MPEYLSVHPNDGDRPVVAVGFRGLVGGMARRGARLGGTLMLALGLVGVAVPAPRAPAPRAPALSVAFRAPLTMDASVGVTEAEVQASNAKAASAYGALVQMWRQEYAQVGVRFTAPALARYRGPIRTRCGVITPSNASYCLAANTIYFDDVFLAAQGKIAGRALGTDGDMAAVGIIAHEMGHAVAMQLGYRSADSYANEAVADCLAGAFARRSAADGSLEDGDIDEAFFGMASAGDPTPNATGDARIDRRIAYEIARNSHGTRDQRMANFRGGLDGGSAVCLPQFRR